MSFEDLPSQELGQAPPSSSGSPILADPPVPSSGKDYTVCDQCRARKIRCGRERPRCSNCHRLGLRCKWSGYGKKPNRATILSHTVAALETRINEVQKAVSSIQETLNGLNLDRCQSSDQLAIETNQYAQPVSRTASFSLPQASSRGTSFPSSYSYIACNPNSVKQYVGPTSLSSLILCFVDSVVVPLCAASSRSRVQLNKLMVAAGRLRATAEQRQDLELGFEHLPPRIPPFVVLEAVVAPYFDHINPSLPIWSEEFFRQRLAVFEQSSDNINNRGDLVCFNSVALLTLTEKSLRRWTTTTSLGLSGPQKSKLRSMDLDMCELLLSNASRAAQNIEALLTPKLINVQALISLYLVGQLHWGTERAGIFLNLAAMMAKSIRLHEWTPLRSQTDNEEAQERQRVFYCLYILDRSACLTDGQTSNFLLEKNLEFLFESCWQEKANERYLSLMVRAKLARIEGQIYSTLYSGPGCGRPTEEVDQNITSLGEEFERFYSRHGPGQLGDACLNQHMSPADLELSAIAHSVHQFLYWPAPDRSRWQEQLVRSARVCLTSLYRLWTWSGRFGNQLSTIRIVANYAPISFLHLSSHVLLDGQEAEADLKLLKSFIETTRAILCETVSNTRLKMLAQCGDIVLDLISGLHSAKYSRSTSLFANDPTSSNQNDNRDFFSQRHTTTADDIAVTDSAIEMLDTQGFSTPVTNIASIPSTSGDMSDPSSSASVPLMHDSPFADSSVYISVDELHCDYSINWATEKD